MSTALRPQRPRSPGFTLVEMLVVISIVTMRVALLLPALSKARSSARSISCMNNHHQIQKGIQYYADDYRRHFPHPETVFDPGDTVRWGHALYRPNSFAINNWPNHPRGYITDRFTFLCPEMETGIRDVRLAGPTGQNWTGMGKSYGWYDVEKYEVEDNKRMLKTASLAYDWDTGVAGLETLTFKFYDLEAMPTPGRYALTACVAGGSATNFTSGAAVWDNRFSHTDASKSKAWMIHTAPRILASGMVTPLQPRPRNCSAWPTAKAPQSTPPSEAFSGTATPPEKVSARREKIERATRLADVSDRKPERDPCKRGV